MVYIVTGNCINCNKFFTNKNSTGKYCSNVCQQEYRYINDTIPKIIEGKIYGRPTLKRYLIKKREHRCECCLNTEWSGQPITRIGSHRRGCFK